MIEKPFGWVMKYVKQKNKKIVLCSCFFFRYHVVMKLMSKEYFPLSVTKTFVQILCFYTKKFYSEKLDK